MRTTLVLPALILILSACTAPAPSETPPGFSSVPTALTPTRTPDPIPTESPTQAPTLMVIPAETSPAQVGCQEGVTACFLPGHFVFQRPVDPAATTVIDQTYRYGATQDGKRDPHHGVDFPNREGSSVLAAGSGEVVVAGNDKLALYGWVTSFYGNLVVIEHRLPGFGGPIYTLYGHLSKVSVQVGQNVEAGDKIGEVGATGIAIGSHLHLEVRITNNDYKSTRNPELWL